MNQSPASDAEAEALLQPWEGPLGGLPPFEKATPAAIERAYRTASDLKRAEIRAIADSDAPPSFENVIVALEESGRALRRVETLFRVFASTMSGEEMRGVEQRLSPLRPQLDDEIAHDDRLFARIEAVHAARSEAGLSDEQVRVTEVIRDRLRRRGAGLDAQAKARLAAINGRLAELEAKFNQNLTVEQEQQAVILDDEADLAGLTEAQIAVAARTAADRGLAGKWAIRITRPQVLPFLKASARRDLREKVWRMAAMQGDNPGAHDNKPVIAEMLRLRGEKARLFGYPDFAHFATADRMVRTPETAMALMLKVWESILGPTEKQIADLQAIADAEGADFQIARWDRLHYLEKLRSARFGLETAQVRPYFKLESIIEAMFWVAGQQHGLEFTAMPDAPVYHPDVFAYAVTRGGEPVGAIWFDLFPRAGKQRGSWQYEYRAAENLHGRVLPLSSIISSIEPGLPGEPTLLAWEYATVLFHELGHALHMLSSKARYPSLGSMAIEWDAIELPSLLNERGLLDRDLLRKFAVHHETGEPIPLEMIDAIEQAAAFDRVFSVTLDYLAMAIIDMEMHLAADGGEVDAVRIERDVLARLGMPEAMDLIMRVPHFHHAFTEHYAAAVYAYLWSDVMAADVADVFTASPGGFHDPAVAERWRKTILEVGASVPADQAFRNFRERDPDPGALLRRFDLETVD